MNEWGYYKMVRPDEPKTLKEMEEEDQQKFKRLKEFVQKYKYAIMDEDDEIVHWYTTYEQAEEELLMMKNTGEENWYIKEVTEEMKNKVISL